MSVFKQFADVVNSTIEELKSTNENLYKVNISREQLWETYQNSFPEGENEIFRERKEHDCQTCYSFIKMMGAVVSINEDLTITTIWKDYDKAPYPYNIVGKTLNELVLSGNVTSMFIPHEKYAGKEFNIEAETNITWNHFYADVSKFFKTDRDTLLGKFTTNIALFKRALDEFSEESLLTVIDLCDIAYRGQEFKSTVEKFLTAKRTYENSNNKQNFIIKEYVKYPFNIRNTAIGTLIKDISNGEDLEIAIKSFELVVAPSNYKRTTAIVTPAMKEAAMKKIEELGIRESLYRRHATLADISVNDVLFSSNSAKNIMKDKLDDILETKPKATKTMKGVSEIAIENFIANVLPEASKIEVAMENKHIGNLVTLVAPENQDSPNILKWDNNFTWSYKGEVTDSMKERVKELGGKVDGVLRFTIQWNETDRDRDNDLDAHCRIHSITENREIEHIYYANRSAKKINGTLDVDIQRPGRKTAVENIIFTNKSELHGKKFNFKVHNFARTNYDGCRCQIEYEGQLFEYNVNKSIVGTIDIAKVTVDHEGNFIIEHAQQCSSVPKDIWKTTTQEYTEVSSIMLSPNYWGANKIGNKHYFFMLDGCENPDRVRGFYNEFLDEKLSEHRKTFEMISSKMVCEHSIEQLSGLGFSSTKRDELNVKVDGRPYLIKF